jgi:hypothetical protein
MGGAAGLELLISQTRLGNLLALFRQARIEKVNINCYRDVATESKALPKIPRGESGSRA